VLFLPEKIIHTATSFNGTCASDSFLMQAGNLNAETYRWNDGSSGKERKINRTGVYWVTYEIDSSCTRYVDSFIISYPEEDPKVSFFLSDTIICLGDTLRFQNTSAPQFDRFEWSFGNIASSTLVNPEYIPESADSFTVLLVGTINGICADTTSRI